MRSLRRAVTGGILLPQRAGGAVARIGERRLALRDQAGVELLEVLEREEHLAAHLEHLRAPGIRRCRCSRSGTSSMVRTLSVTSSPVRPSPRVAAADQPPVAVDQLERHPVDLQLAQLVRVVADLARRARPAHAASSSAENTLSSDSIRSRCSAAVNSVAKPAPPTRWVGESGVSNSGYCVLQRLQFAQQRVELAVGDDRGVQDVVAELVAAHLVGEVLPSPAQVGVGSILGLFGQRGLRVRGRLRAHPGRLAEAADTDTPSRYPGPMPHPIMFRDDDPVLAKVRKVALGFPGGLREGVTWQAGVLRHEDVRDVRRQRQTGTRAPTTSSTRTRSWSRSTRATAGPSSRIAGSSSPPTWGRRAGSGWTSRPKKVDWDEVTELVDASFRLVAPKKLISCSTKLDPDRRAMVRSGP